MKGPQQRPDTDAALAPPSVGVLVTGVTPFEDLPGFQFYSMLKGDARYRVEIGDDSEPALAVLSATGASITHLAHPGEDEERFISQVRELCQRQKIRFIVPGADAHLFALARAFPTFSALASLCPAAAWLAERGLRNKWDLQEWIESYLPVARRWKYEEGDPIPSELGQGPVLVKGMRKGAAPCKSVAEIPFALDHILENPANQGPFGGCYLEEKLDGEEQAVLLVRTNETRSLVLGIRKLATTQTGTTLAAAIEEGCIDEITLSRLADELLPGMAMELEAIRDDHRLHVFEVNLRFPSWLGALAETGRRILDASIQAQLGIEVDWKINVPVAGTIIYRLPQSGYLSPSEAFEAPKEEQRKMCLLWPSAAPHQFRVK